MPEQSQHLQWDRADESDEDYMQNVELSQSHTNSRCRSENNDCGCSSNIQGRMSMSLHPLDMEVIPHVRILGSRIADTTLSLSGAQETHEIGWGRGDWEQGNTAHNHIRPMNPSMAALHNERASEFDHEGYECQEEEEDIGECTNGLTNDNPRRRSLCGRFERRSSGDVPPLADVEEPAKSKGGRGIKKFPKKKRGEWTDRDLHLAMAALDNGCKIQQVCKKYKIPRTSLRDHYYGKTRTRKIGPKTILTQVEEQELITYMEQMVKWGCPLNTCQLQTKVAEITQTRLTPFTNGIPGKSWVKWFMHRHPNLVKRVPEALEMNRGKALNPENVAVFYQNLKKLYDKHNYEPWQIWNCDESGVQANKNGEAAVLAAKGTRRIHTMVPNEREWLSVLVAVNAGGGTMPNYYVFKGKRLRQQYISQCENGACIGMQENGYMDTDNFSKWMDFFIDHHKNLENLSHSKRMLLILDGHKSHVSMEVLEKAQNNQIDMLSLPSHTSHELQPLDISCFKPFKTAFRTYRDMWRGGNVGSKVKKEDLAQWVSLSLQKALKPSTIKAGFKTAGIFPFNRDAMLTKMGPNELFQQEQCSSEPDTQHDLESDESSTFNDLRVEEIVGENIPNEHINYVHCYVDIEGENPNPSQGCTFPEPASSQDQHNFLKIPRVQVAKRRIRNEPLVDYRHSQILTSTDHVAKLKEISEKKISVERERAEKQEQKDLTKRKRDQERLLAEAAKKRKIAEKEAQKISRESWTPSAIRKAGEKLHALLRSGDVYENLRPRLNYEALRIAKQNRTIAKTRLEAKKETAKHGIPFSWESFPPLVEHPCFYGLQEAAPFAPKDTNAEFTTVAGRIGLNPWIPNSHIPRNVPPTAPLVCAPLLQPSQTSQAGQVGGTTGLHFFPPQPTSMHGNNI